jgi:L-threonylcarbamoyladenylate synthase
MKIISEKSESAVVQAVKILKNGGLIAYPTDTVYGLGVDATSDEAAERLYSIKEREKDKPIHVVVSGVNMAKNYVSVNNDAQKIISHFLPGPLTIVLKNKGLVSKEITGENDTLGIRIPKSDFILSVVKEFGKPVTTTSANKAGGKAPHSVEEIKESFGEDFEKIDLIIDAGQLKNTPPSTLVDLSNEEVKVLREGPIIKEEILKVLK